METIKSFMNDLPDMVTKDGKRLRDTMAAATPIWSNDICRGYLIDAMERAGISQDIQDKIISALWESFDMLTYSEAEEKGK